LAGAGGERTMGATLSLEQLSAHESRAVYAQAGWPKSDLVDQADLKQARQCLSARENRVISLLYERDWKNSDVARELGVSESRISQINTLCLPNFARVTTTNDDGAGNEVEREAPFMKGYIPRENPDLDINPCRPLAYAYPRNQGLGFI
jgi:hypothetical protein